MEFHDEIEMKGSYFVVSFWNDLNLESLPYEIHIHKDQFEKWVNKKELLDKGYAGYNSSEDYKVKISFEQLISEVDYSEEFRAYITQMAKELLNAGKVEILEKEVEKLSREYSDLLHMYRLLQGAPVPNSSPMRDLKQAIVAIHKNHVEEVKEGNRPEISEEVKHCKEIYQGIYPAYELKKQANG
jgi:hypothetical protein